VAGLQAPAVQLLSSVSRGDARSLTLRLQANGAERIVMIAPASARIRSAGMPGFVRPIAGRGDQGKVTISCTGRSCDGATLLVDQGGTGTIDFTVIGSRNGLPPSAAPLVRARPSLARPQYVPDETVTVSHVRI
jgi:hypothetical protein